jgi:UDP-N-acetylmuramoyl-L-alanyl-D-glutamate--2,6-diaminopimelate ligase
MRLSELLEGFSVTPPDANPAITDITEDSRRTGPGVLFVAVPGTMLDGHAYIADAVSRGAAAVVAERTGAIPLGVPVVRVPSSRKALAVLAARFYGSPGEELPVIGFTGTFGKTSTSEILRSFLDAGGARTAVLGSLGARFAGLMDPGAGLTTPSPVDLHRLLRALLDAGASTAILEVTSHALALGRVSGLSFAGGLLAAIMPGEHTDFHRSYEAYVDAKRRFLSHLRPEAPLAYDADNHAARRLAAAHAADHLGATIGFSIGGREADLRVYDVTLDETGARFALGGTLSDARAGGRVHSPLLGAGHLRNVGLALAYALGAGLRLEAIETVLSTLTPLRRRMERYGAAGRTILDDTAAHPDSFRAAFEVAALLPHRSLAVVYAIRGRRGSEINRQNGLALADLCFLHGAEPLVVTSSADATGPADAAQLPEIDAARHALVSRGRRFVWHDHLAEAVKAALERTQPGDLILLLGAQGMNEGKALLHGAA